MRYGFRVGWRGKYASIAARAYSLAEALEEARRLRRQFEARVWITAPGAPATVRASTRQPRLPTASDAPNP
jgi:hypothetical protein